ncbi:cyclic pyranopterin monophosphate synthase MoaC [Desulfurispirillum indicum]|uniref:Cyclic pyranopterin monophosphate synthase n=1 Tax=Desulfurispirillum indicum (strain ATCC BAA-1389 / DSM 22839 / S5) TaxID=653733 RepID=E6W5C4_DESIS|nr:cyclic pyranopterin monophosphate synthase MoaC [Desulfurispirillum indicum]ADU64855.1 molybdenum cofactor biosynthesis protein C [Desulfurispirillum indicum S5]UCZ56786.1 cyclic pyranopterin monophosphate synthase MoaC [Desulfurispirillum indicum]
MELTHFDQQGNAIMVDVSRKEDTVRVARATATVIAQPQTIEMIRQGTHKKGDVLGVARVAGIMAAKRTSDLIPMCHPIPIEGVSVDFEVQDERVIITTELRTTYKTGIEVEAVVAASIAASTIYDMCKAVDRAMEITNIRLLYKAGGKSGVFERQ